MTKRNFTFLLAGLTVLTTVITSGFTFRETDEDGKGLKYEQHGCCSSNGQKNANGSIVGYTNSVPDGPGSCSSGGGCHSGGSVTPVFSFTATPAFTGNAYVPGADYTIAIKVTGYAKFGFDVEMLDGTLSSSTAIGTFVALTNCQIHPAGAFPKSVTHLSPILSSGSATFKWTAPASGNVYVYACGNGVNGNGNDGGDKAVLYSALLAPDSLAGVESAVISNFSFSVFPNPANEYISLLYDLNKDSQVSAKLVSLAGKVVSTFFEKELQNSGKQGRKLLIDPSVAEGVYLLSLEINGKYSFKKIVLQ